ncbi:hypothetical protein [Mucilaginibacter panaciglaebae]|uniref:Uncharacterized protein n=1 Tax=Mucilaginibacter panaciglaebae TaxID=502331 RepID=A0ABP7WN41_9SPHI
MEDPILPMGNCILICKRMKKNGKSVGARHYEKNALLCHFVNYGQENDFIEIRAGIICTKNKED